MRTGVGGADAGADDSIALDSEKRRLDCAGECGAEGIVTGRPIEVYKKVKRKLLTFEGKRTYTGDVGQSDKPCFGRVCVKKEENK